MEPAFCRSGNATDTEEVTRSEAVVYISEDAENLGSTIEMIGNGYFGEDFGFDFLCPRYGMACLNEDAA